MSQSDPPLHRADPRSRALSEVERYYDDKTARIAQKYGPGPRIHFHTGLDAREVGEGASLDEYRAAMVEAQEALVGHVASDLGAARVLDVGCGLGGAALFLAARGASVTALTNVARHVPVIERLAEIAGAKLEITHGDAHALESFGRYDAVLAIESSCYFDRTRWFHAVARITRRVHVVDCFAGHPGAAPRFDAYWKTRIGSRHEYDSAAISAGFSLAHAEDLAPRAHAFWTLSTAWNESAVGRFPTEATRLARSTVEHAWLQRALATGRIRYVHVVYERLGG